MLGYIVNPIKKVSEFPKGLSLFISFIFIFRADQSQKTPCITNTGHLLCMKHLHTIAFLLLRAIYSHSFLDALASLDFKLSVSQ